ncbi:helix-turn-helix domain-containing protein [Geopsychrobacter electrodiphilus]|uniref:helix-turn-helix domain-containing protein n=1 Tax=Geopsychrobacter electrodiphilus TaxID=225196 RepID=UPI00035DCD66|nr:helix-turn-helix transcriptional regulator [Geopsychrobacter electrodiphilus]
MEDKTRGIGRRVRDIREKLNLTQEDLGKILGVEKGTVSKYENEGTKLSPDALATIASMGKSTIDWLVIGKGPGPGAHSNTNETQTPYGGLNRELAAEVVSFIFETANELGVTLIPEKAKNLFLMIHDEFAATKQIDKAKVIQLIRLAA